MRRGERAVEPGRNDDAIAARRTHGLFLADDRPPSPVSEARAGHGGIRPVAVARRYVSGRHGRRSAGSQAVALSGQGQERHLHPPGRHPVASRIVRPEARTAKTQRRGLPPGPVRVGQVRLRPQPAHHARHARREAIPLHAQRHLGPASLKPAAEPARGGRRDHAHQVAAHRGVQPRPGADVHAHRLRTLRAAQRRGLAELRPGDAQPGLARLRRADHRQRTGRRQPGLGKRLSADRVPGRRVSQPGRSGPVPVEPRGHRPAVAPADHRHG